MEPQCHPEKSKAKTESDLQAEQDEFFLSNSIPCVELKSQRQQQNNNSFYTGISVLNEVVEREVSDAAVNRNFVKPPTFKPAPKPVKVSAPNDDSSMDIDALKAKISKENEGKLDKMSAEEIEELKREVFEGVPESFLNKLRNK